MTQQAHAFLINSPALLNDARHLMNAISPDNRIAFYSVSASISALEAFLNEMVQFGAGKRVHGISDDIVRMAASLKIAEENRLPIPTKFLCGYKGLLGTDLDKGSCQPYQRLRVAIDVRNQLAHPKAATLQIGPNGVHSQEQNQLVKKLVSNGFKIDTKVSYDWHSVVVTFEFALWVYQSVVDCMNLFIDSWPDTHAINSYKEMYSTSLYTPEQWKQFA